MKKKTNLTCAYCGGDAGTWFQWWNLDKGFGICKKCVAFVKNHVPFDKEHLKITEEDFIQNYGKPGINYDFEHFAN